MAVFGGTQSLRCLKGLAEMKLIIKTGLFRNDSNWDIGRQKQLSGDRQAVFLYVF